MPSPSEASLERTARSSTVTALLGSWLALMLGLLASAWALSTATLPVNPSWIAMIPWMWGLGGVGGVLGLAGLIEHLEVAG